MSFLKMKTRSFLKKNKTLRVNLPYKQSFNVGIVFTVENKGKHEQVKELIKKLESDGKKVKVLSFLPKQKENYDFKFDYFTEKEITFWGNIHSPLVTQFADTSFDFLFCFDTTPNPLLLHVLAKSRAACRIGCFWEGYQSFFELMFECKDLDGLSKNMYRYTASLT